MAKHILLADALKSIIAAPDQTADEKKLLIVRLQAIPPADVVSRDCYNRILAENDTMREMLAQIGKKPGDKMDDVRIVARGTWKIADSYAGPGLMNLKCSVCGEFGGTWKENTFPSLLYKFCPNCGADMRETGR